MYYVPVFLCYNLQDIYSISVTVFKSWFLQKISSSSTKSSAETAHLYIYLEHSLMFLAITKLVISLFTNSFPSSVSINLDFLVDFVTICLNDLFML